MSKSKRIYVNIGIFGALLFLPITPWYVVFVAGIIAAWYYTYYELLLIGFIMDISYGSKLFFSFFDFPYPLPCATLAAILLIILHLVKKRVRF